MLLVAGVALLGLSLAACSGSDGAAGSDGNSCTVEAAADGTTTVTCSDGTTATIPAGTNGTDGTDGTNGTDGTDGTDGATGTDGADGADGTSCTVVDNGDATKTISCTDGTTVTVADGTPGADGTSCTVVDNGGSKTINCDDGTTATVTDGVDGVDGTSCTVVDGGNGVKTISCDDGSTVTVSDGLPGHKTVALAAEMPEMLTVTVTGVSIGATSTVDFTVVDPAGRGAVGLLARTTGGHLRFNLVKLVAPTATDSGRWQAYLDSANTNANNPGVTTTRAGSERNGTLVDHGDGTYTYTFLADLTAQTDAATGAAIPFEPNLTHRLGIQMSGTLNARALPAYNAIYDFVPAGGPVVTTREIVASASCNECHGELRAHGSRYELKYCVTCHNPGTSNASSVDQANVNTGSTFNLGPFIHALHSANMRKANLAPAYVLAGDWSEVTYPQGIESCRKCHDGADAATPQGDNWKAFPTTATCGGCHANIDIRVGTGHLGGPQANDNLCAMCHTPAAIESYHQSENDTPNNPGVPAPLSRFTYEILSATANGSNQAVIEFRVMRDGTSLDMTTLPADLSGGPSFLVAYAMAQDGVTTPVYYNNLGKAAAQPATVSLANLRNSSQGTIAASVANPGYYTATLTVAASLFPAGSSLRAVALQGYFSQVIAANATPEVPAGTYARHAVSAVRPIAGDTARAEIVGNAKCANCHEWFEGHGGNRVYDTRVCVMCHNNNLSTSGRGSNPAQMDAANQALATAAGFDPAQPLLFPEKSNNFKDMIHSIHGADKRSTPFEFVRNRGASGVFFYDMSEVKFPGYLNRCETCHNAGTYETSISDGQLVSTQITTNGAIATTADVNASRTTVPNLTDIVTTPIAATCAACHDTTMAAAHMELNGALVNVERQVAAAGYIETCDLCHGAGRLADVALVHGD